MEHGGWQAYDFAHSVLSFMVSRSEETYEAACELRAVRVEARGKEAWKRDTRGV